MKLPALPSPSLRALPRLLLAACTLTALPACVGVPGEYGYGGYGYDDGIGYSSYRSRPVSYYGSGSSHYGSSYYHRPYYYGGGPRYYRGSSYSRDHDHDHDRHDYRRGSGSRGSSSSRKSSDNDIRLVKVRDGTRGDIPKGYHSKEWFQKRGISVSKNVYQTRDGDRRGYSGGGSKDKKKR